MTVVFEDSNRIFSAHLKELAVSDFARRASVASISAWCSIWRDGENMRIDGFPMKKQPIACHTFMRSTRGDSNGFTGDVAHCNNDFQSEKTKLLETKFA